MKKGEGSQPDLDSEGDSNLSESRARWHENRTELERSWLDRDAKAFLHQSLSTPCLTVVESCEGAEFVDIEGRRILDFHGNYIHNLGFGHPEILQAVQEQLHTLSFSTRRYTNKPAIELAEKLGQLTNGSLSRALFAPGGAEAMSMALKIARMVTGRHKTISMWDSFHGATLDTISIGGEATFRYQAGPLLPGTEHVPPFNPSECPFECGSACSGSCARYIDYVLEKEGDVAAVIGETIRSSPFLPHPNYWQTVREACDRHGALLILDEIPHAFGRTGAMFTHQHYGIVPDLLVLGKGLGGGVIPFAAVLAKDELNDAIKDRAIGHFTHEKSPLGSRAALAMIEVIERDELVAGAAAKGKAAIIELKAMAESHPWIHDVRGLGLMLGIELRNPESGEPAKAFANDVMVRSLELGLNFKISMGCILNWTPPLTVTSKQLSKAISILNQALLDCQPAA